MKLQININVEYVPLPEDKYFAWEEAMNILIGWLMEINLDEPAVSIDIGLADVEGD